MLCRFAIRERGDWLRLVGAENPVGRFGRVRRPFLREELRQRPGRQIAALEPCRQANRQAQDRQPGQDVSQLRPARVAWHVQGERCQRRVLEDARSPGSVNTLPGPTSRNTRAPSAWICRTSFSNSTGSLKC